MATQDNNSLEAKINAVGLKVGNEVLASTGLAADASQPIYVDSSKKLAVGDIPFALTLAAGVTNTSFSVTHVKGSATGSADELMHLTLVGGANATTTIAGFYRITVTDNADVITDGAYYVPFYTLS